MEQDKEPPRKTFDGLSRQQLLIYARELGEHFWKEQRLQQELSERERQVNVAPYKAPRTALHGVEGPGPPPEIRRSFNHMVDFGTLLLLQIIMFSGIVEIGGYGLGCQPSEAPLYRYS